MSYYITTKENTRDYINRVSAIDGEYLNVKGISSKTRRKKWLSFLNDCSIPVVRVIDFNLDRLVVCYSYEEFSEFVGNDCNKPPRLRMLYAISIKNLLCMIDVLWMVDKDVLDLLKNNQETRFLINESEPIDEDF